MSRFPFVMAVTLALSLIGQSSWAQRAYVSDFMRVTFRTGPSMENKIITMLASGQAVEVLETSGEWSRVQILEQGESTIEGWVLTRFLMSRLPWEVRANALTEENGRLKEKLASVEKELDESTRLSRELAGKLKTTSTAREKLEGQYKSLKKGSTGYLELKTKHESMRSDLQTTKKNLREVTRENEELLHSQRIKWFATGASVLLLGLIFGLILGRKQRKRRSSLYE